MKVVAETSLSDIQKGSEEEFILEHYWGYNKYNERTTIEYGVEHIMWQIHKVKEYHLDCDIVRLYGPSFKSLDPSKAHSVIVAKGSEVIIRKPSYIRI